MRLIRTLQFDVDKRFVRRLARQVGPAMATAKPVRSVSILADGRVRMLFRVSSYSRTSGFRLDGRGDRAGQFVLRHRGAYEQLLARAVAERDRLPAVLRRHGDADLDVAFGVAHLTDHARNDRANFLARSQPQQHGAQIVEDTVLDFELALRGSEAERHPARILQNVAHQITLIPGDGIGPEVAEATARVVEATGVEVEWDRVDAGVVAERATGKYLPEAVFESLARTKVGLKGPVGTPIASGHPSVNVALRKRLNLFVNFRPVKMLPGLKTRFADLPIDLVIFRENTEDLYSGIEHEVVTDVVESLKVITRTASIRIAQAAFEYAAREHRTKVTAIHKANIMKLSDGLFLRCCREVAAKFPQIEYGELIVDNACMQLVMRPETFDILVLPNLYGDIVSDLTAGLVGGLGIVPGANLGDDMAVFEAVHGSAPDIAGKGLANPTALMQSARLMLAHLGERDAAVRMQKAIEAVYAEGKHLTRDVGGAAGTAEFTDAVISGL